MATTAIAEKKAYDVAMENFDIAADALGLDNDMRNMIKYPERVLSVVLPVRMDNGKILRFDGYRVQHSAARGPAKGGIRFHPNVTPLPACTKSRKVRMEFLISPPVKP